MTEPTYGVIFNRADTDPLPPIYADFSVVGIVTTSADADASVFPLNEPVDVNTADQAVLTAAGTGDLYRTLTAINAQLAPFQGSARAVVVRVTKGANDAETITNLVGSAGSQTGLYALLKAPQKLAVTPRLIIVPGYTWQETLDVNGDPLENAVLAALPGVLTPLLAHAIVSSGPLSKTDALAWRQLIASDRIIPVSNRVIVQDGVATATVDCVAAIVGQAIATDFEHQGFPFWSFANRPVQGILGLERYDSFSLTDGATDGQILLNGNIGVIERGELGVDTAVASNGFIVIATDNAGSDELWRFYNQTRGRDFIHLAMLKSIRARLGRNNITPHGVQAVENDMVAVLSDLKARDCIVGGAVGFERDQNSPENLRAGKFRVFFKAEEPAPIRQVTVDSRRDRNALVAELDLLVQQAATLTV